MVIAHVIRMACSDFGVNQAEQQSPEHRNHRNQQQQDKRGDRLFLHYLHHDKTRLSSWATLKLMCVRCQLPVGRETVPLGVLPPEILEAGVEKLPNQAGYLP